MRAALKQKRSKNMARQKVVKSSERLSIALLPGRHNRSLAKQSVGSARVFFGNFFYIWRRLWSIRVCREEEELSVSEISPLVATKQKAIQNFFKWKCKWQMVKKIIKKKLTDIDKASRCALAELSRLVRKADFNNSWGKKKWRQKQIWILTNLTRDMSRRGLYADCMICDQLTPDGDCSKNNLKNEMRQR